RRERAARNHQAVVGISGAGNHQTGLGIYLYRLIRIIEGWIEDRHVAPQRAVWNDYRVADAVVEVQLLIDLPGILCEALPHVAPEDGVSTVADFGISIEQAQSGVGDGRAGGGEAGAV